MSPPPTPPPLPSAHPPSPLKRKANTAALWIVLGVGSLAFVAVVGVVAAVLIPTVAKVRETARRTVDGSNLRQVVQGAMIWAIAHDSRLPPVHLTATGEDRGSTPATIHAVAAALAREGGLADARVWFSAAEHGRHHASFDAAEVAPVLNAEETALDPVFAQEGVLAWDFVTGLDLSLPPTTPVAWTRGLRADGTWDPDTAVYGDDGGQIAFLSGTVQFLRDLRATPLTRPDGTQTSNVLETLPTSARVVGSGPGTLHGERGRSEP